MSSDWNSVSLGECVEFDTGFPFKSAQYTESEAGVRLLRGDNIGQGSLRWEGAKRWIRKANDSLEVYELRQNDLVLAMDRPWIAAGLKFAKVRDNDLPALLVQRVARLRPKPHMDVDYLHSVISSPDFTLHIQNVTTGTAVPHISGRQIQDYKFALPDLGTQRSVGKFLMSLDDRITLLRETNDTLEAIAQALFKSWFVNFEPVRAKMEGRAPEGIDEVTAALFPDSFEESELGLVPKGWKVGAFSDVCTISSGKRPTDRSDQASGSCLTPLYGGAGVMGYTSAPLFDQPKILTGRVGTLGKVHIAYPPFWASDNVLVITPKDEATFSFVLHCLKSVDVLALNRGSTQPLLTQRDLGAQRGVIPSQIIVAEFENVIAPLYERIQQNEAQAKTLADLRETLLPRLISGRIRLPAD